MGNKQRLTRRAALGMMGSGAILATGETFGIASSVLDRLTKVNVTDDAQALLGIEQLPPAQFNAVVLTNNTTRAMEISATTGRLRTVAPDGGPLTLLPGQQRRVAFSTDATIQTEDSVRLVGSVSNYDIIADVSETTAVQKTATMAVTDGSLTVDFTTVADNAKLSAIEVYRV